MSNVAPHSGTVPMMWDARPLPVNPSSSVVRQVIGSPGRARLTDWCLTQIGEQLAAPPLKVDDVTTTAFTSEFPGGEKFWLGEFHNGANFPADSYVVRWQRGAWIDSSVGPFGIYAITTTSDQQFNWNSGRRIYVKFDGGAALAFFNEIRNPAFHTSQWAAERTVRETLPRGLFAAFDHHGGRIQLRFSDQPIDDNRNNDPTAGPGFARAIDASNPIFCLYRVIPVLNLGYVNLRWVSPPSPRVNAEIQIGNETVAPHSGLVGTLYNVSGLSAINFPLFPTNPYSIPGSGLRFHIGSFDLHAGNPSPIGTARWVHVWEGQTVADLTIEFFCDPRALSFPDTWARNGYTFGGQPATRFHVAYVNFGNCSTFAMSPQNITGIAFPDLPLTILGVTNNLNPMQAFPYANNTSMDIYVQLAGAPVPLGLTINCSYDLVDGSWTLPGFSGVLPVMAGP